VKTRAGIRVLPLVPPVRAALIAQRDRQAEQRSAAGTEWNDTGYVFTTRTERAVEPRNISRSFDRIISNAGLPQTAFHDLRRTAATTLAIYREVFDTEIASVLARMDTALDGSGLHDEPRRS
jgi:integrase